MHTVATGMLLYDRRGTIEQCGVPRRVSRISPIPSRRVSGKRLLLPSSVCLLQFPVVASISDGGIIQKTQVYIMGCTRQKAAGDLNGS